jgi:hypothetical protein
MIQDRPDFNIRDYCAWVKFIGIDACDPCSFVQCPANHANYHIVAHAEFSWNRDSAKDDDERIWFIPYTAIQSKIAGQNSFSLSTITLSAELAALLFRRTFDDEDSQEKNIPTSKG